MCAVIRRQGDSIFWWGLYPTEEESSNFFGFQGDPKIPSLSEWNSPHKENPEEGASSTCFKGCVHNIFASLFFKSKRENLSN